MRFYKDWKEKEVKMTTKLAKILKKQFSEMPAEMYEPLTFGDLNQGDKFIPLPLPGDNSGHGGFMGSHYMFVKIYRVIDYNAVRLQTGTLYAMSEDRPVIKVE